MRRLQQGEYQRDKIWLVIHRNSLFIEEISEHLKGFVLGYLSMVSSFLNGIRMG